MRKLLCTTIPIAALFVSANAGAQELCSPMDPISWLENSAIFGGDCRADQPGIITNGSEVAILFTGIGIELWPNGPALSDRKNCAVAIRASVAKGKYTENLVQTVDYAVTKGMNTLGKLDVRSTFFGIPLPKIDLLWDYNTPADIAVGTETVTYDATQDPLGDCDPAIRNGLYRGNFAVSARIDPNASDDIKLFVDGVGLKYAIGPSTGPIVSGPCGDGTCDPGEDDCCIDCMTTNDGVCCAVSGDPKIEAQMFVSMDGPAFSGDPATPVFEWELSEDGLNAPNDCATGTPADDIDWRLCGNNICEVGVVLDGSQYDNVVTGDFYDERDGASPYSCPQDCGTTFCGEGTCDEFEEPASKAPGYTCAADCP